MEWSPRNIYPYHLELLARITKLKYRPMNMRRRYWFPFPWFLFCKIHPAKYLLSYCRCQRRMRNSKSKKLGQFHNILARPLKFQPVKTSQKANHPLNWEDRLHYQINSKWKTIPWEQKNREGYMWSKDWDTSSTLEQKRPKKQTFCKSSHGSYFWEEEIGEKPSSFWKLNLQTA